MDCLKILNSLIELAKENDGVGRKGKYHYRFAAMLKIKGYSPFIGFNKIKSHPLQKKYGRHPEAIFLHAEIDVIKTALRDIDMSVLEKSTLYIARVKKDAGAKKFSWGLSRPCTGCQGAIEAFNINKVIFTTDIDNEYEIWKR